MSAALRIPSLQDVRDAQARLAGLATRTPLLRLPGDGPVATHLKLENLQPIGSFKLRGAGNALLSADPDTLSAGVWTASAGNMGQGVAWTARQLDVCCTVVVPDHAPQTKLAALQRLGASVVSVPFDEWWRTMLEHEHPGMQGLFVHPVCDAAVIAGNGTIALELLEDLPDVDAVLVPYGGGGLSCGIAAALRALRPQVRVIACEIETAAPLTASLAAGEPVSIAHEPSFVDGIGGKSVLPAMWPLVSELLSETIVVPLDEVAAAVRLLATRAHVVAEGAGATPVAAALRGGLPDDVRCVAAIVSGGNIDAAVLATILAGGMP